MAENETEIQTQKIGFYSKWPQMTVTGFPVSVEQAKEIIRRTDSFITHGYDGNNREFNKMVRKLLGMPPDTLYMSDEERREFANSGKFGSYWEDTRAWRESWGVIETEYVHNNWISCSWIGGAHGWCHPNGQIGSCHNIGKWPSSIEVYEDWKKIAEAFPFLELGVSFIEEEGQEQAGGSLYLRDGKVAIFGPGERDVHRGHPDANSWTRPDAGKDGIERFMASMTGDPFARREIGIPLDWLVEWAKVYNPEGLAELNGKLDL